MRCHYRSGRATAHVTAVSTTCPWLIGGGLPRDSFFVRDVHTPSKARGKGHARRLMARILADADAASVPLVLRAEPYDAGPSAETLTGWYHRLGFGHGRDWHDGIPILMRAPCPPRN